MASQESSKIKDLEQHIGRLREQVPSVTNLLEAFQDLLIKEIEFKETLVQPVIELSGRDLEQDFRAGIPFGSRVDVKIPEEGLKRAQDIFIPALSKGFPSIAKQMENMDLNAEKSNQLIGSLVEVVLTGKNSELEEHSKSQGVEPDVLLFVITRLIKPFAEKWGETVGLFVENMEWLKGYCPLCGSWPNISFWKGDGGKRWLHCSFCGHEWTFIRTACPFCENSDQQRLESIYSEDRPFEAADVCLECNRYLLRNDLREEVHDVFPEVLALSMTYLDALVQEKGFRPPSLDEHPPCQAN
jgi:FdhE protein